MPTPTTVGPSDVSLLVASDAVQRTYQRKSFFALGRHWVFYLDPTGPILLFDSSLHDSGVWDGPAPPPIPPLSTGAEVSVWLQELDPALAYVHLAFCDSTGPNDLLYIRGLLIPDGTIIWDPIQLVLPLMGGIKYENIGICLDHGIGGPLNAFVYIVYTAIDVVDINLSTPWCITSITSDGTWSTMNWDLLTPVGSASWVPLVVPLNAEAMVIYTSDNGDIFSRLYAGAILGAEVDTGFDIGADAQKISAVSERYRATSQDVFSARAAYVAFQAADWDLYCIRYENLAWQAAPANTIEVIGPFREANPLLSILYSGDEDPTVDDHGLATLYCFWTPTTDSPLAEWVTYRVSRNLGDTWTDEDGVDQARSWISEVADGFEVQQSGSSYFHSSEDSDRAVSYLGLVYVTHRMPPVLRHAALGFDDPDEDLPAEFVVRHPDQSEELLGEFIVRHSSPDDPGPDLLGEFIVRQVDESENLLAVFESGQGSRDLAGEFIVRPAGSQNLLGKFNSRQPGSVDLLGEFIVRQVDASENLLAVFESGQGSGDLAAEFVAGQWRAELLGKVIVRQAASAELLGEFEIRRSGDEELLGEFDVRRPASQELAAKFVVRQAASAELLGEFVVRHSGDEELLGEFVVRHSDSEDLPGEFNISRDDWISQGLNVAVYRDLGVIS